MASPRANPFARQPLTRPATTLDELPLTTQITPLDTEEKVNAFYSEDLNKARGIMSPISTLANALNEQPADYFKACLYGHIGCGKTTELKRLEGLIDDYYVPVYIDLKSALDPYEFDALDIVLIMMERLIKEAEIHFDNSFDVNKKLYDAVVRWFSSETSTWTENTKLNSELKAGLDTTRSTFISVLSGAFVKATAGAQYASNRETTVIERRRKSIGSLVDLCNDMLTDFSSTLSKKSSGKQWVFIFDGLEKSEFDPDKIKDFFVRYGASVINKLQAHMIFIVPIWLCYNGDEVHQLPFSAPNRLLLPDVHVYCKNHTTHLLGRNVLKDVLTKRMEPHLFETPDVQDRLIVASGGSLRDLFDLLLYARRCASLHKRDKLTKEDVDYAINSAKVNLRMYLMDSDEISSVDKLNVLKGIYKEGLTPKTPDKILKSLLRARLVQEFNGTRWFGLPPLVVDILMDYADTPDGYGLPKGSPGGTI
jgi:energy-coupling factor transporter ATP-binding protein EcfA2